MPALPGGKFCATCLICVGLRASATIKVDEADAPSFAASYRWRRPLRAGAAADELDLKTARTLLQTILGSDLKKEQIQVKSIKSGGSVEAQIETTFRFAREGKEWKIAEVRLGDKHWESIELVEEAIKREKARRTQVFLVT